MDSVAIYITNERLRINYTQKSHAGSAGNVRRRPAGRPITIHVTVAIQAARQKRDVLRSTTTYWGTGASAMLAVHPRTPESKGKARICNRNTSEARTVAADRDKEEQDDDESAQAESSPADIAAVCSPQHACGVSSNNTGPAVVNCYRTGESDRNDDIRELPEGFELVCYSSPPPRFLRAQSHIKELIEKSGAIFGRRTNTTCHGVGQYQSSLGTR